MKRQLVIIIALQFLLSGVQAYPTPKTGMEKIKAKDLEFTMKAFMFAVTFDRHDDIRWYVEAGMNIDETHDGNQYYAIHDAANSRREDTTVLLLELGADPNKRSKNGQTALHFAVKNHSTGLIKPLIKKGADVNAATDHGRTPLHMAVANGHLDTVLRLINLGAKVDVKDENGRTPLLAAMNSRRYEMVEPLIKAGANVNVTSQKGRAKDLTPLVQAIRLHDRALISLLIEAGADVNATTFTGFTPVMVTLLENDALSLVQLIAHRARVNDKGGRNQTPLQMCLQRSEHRLCDLLVKAGATMKQDTENLQSALFNAVRSQRYSEVQQLLEKGARPNAGERIHQRPLYAAVMHADAKMVALLIKHGADVNWQDPTTGQNLAFLFAKQQLIASSVLDVLLKAGLNLNVVDCSGQTPLFHAAANTRSQILTIMMKAGADVNAVNKIGWSALMNSARMGRIENVRALLDAGADAHLKLNATVISGQQGRTAHEIAVLTRNHHCAELIKKAATKRR